jgi:hypothetical protein
VNAQTQPAMTPEQTRTRIAELEAELATLRASTRPSSATTAVPVDLVAFVRTMPANLRPQTGELPRVRGERDKWLQENAAGKTFIWSMEITAHGKDSVTVAGNVSPEVRVRGTADDKAVVADVYAKDHATFTGEIIAVDSSTSGLINLTVRHLTVVKVQK